MLTPLPSRPAAVMHEVGLGQHSRWFGYLSSLPPREHLTVFWDPELLALLKGKRCLDRCLIQYATP